MLRSSQTASRRGRRLVAKRLEVLERGERQTGSALFSFPRNDLLKKEENCLCKWQSETSSESRS